jgi:hypothetical protein
MYEPKQGFTLPLCSLAPTPFHDEPFVDAKRRGNNRADSERNELRRSMFDTD